MLSSSSVGFQIPYDMQLSPITEISVDDIDVTGAFSQGNTTDFLGGNGTEDSPYLIKTAKHFMNIKLYPDAYYKLSTDIDMTDVTFLAINQFSGVLDGALHSVYNLNFIEDTSDTDVYVGLFKKNFGTIQNLKIKDCIFTASPKFKNIDTNVYCGSIAAMNSGIIRNCIVSESNVAASSSNIGDLFFEKYEEDSRDLVRGAKNWKAWISQSFALSTSNWSENLLFKVYAGGVVGVNSGIIENCSFVGNVEANLYNMLVQSSTKEQTCLAGGITAMNSGSVKSVTTTANVTSWIELDNDARGMGWIGDTYPKGICFACGIVGGNLNDSIVSGQANGSQKADSRIYVPQYAFLQGASYSSTSKGHATNLTIDSNSSYCNI